MADNEAANGEAEGAISQPTMLAHFDRRVKRRSAAAGSPGKDKASVQVEDAGNAREARAAAAEDDHPTVKVEEDAVEGIFSPAYTLMRLCPAEALPEPPISRFWTRGDRVEPETVHGEAPPLSPRGTHAQPLLRRHQGRGKGLGRCRGCGHADGSPLSLVPLPHCASILDPLGRTGLLFFPRTFRCVQLALAVSTVAATATAAAAAAFAFAPRAAAPAPACGGALVQWIPPRCPA